MDGAPDSGMPVETQNLRSGRDFCSIPYQYTWVLQNSVESVLEASMDEFRFVANFLVFFQCGFWVFS